jgi:nucleotidyltransferase/DNA polymerase involved in DNA repair
MQDYVDVSRKIRTIFREFTPLVEPMSIDEAFLDVSGYAEDDNESIELARRLKKREFETEALTASVGIAPSKFVAKIASDLEKPDGLVHVPRLGVQHFLDPLPVSKIWGVGPRTEEKLKSMELHTIGELRSVERGLLASRFGKLGDHLWRLANGIDGRDVVTHRGVKSVSQERTFSEDTDSREVLVGVLEKLSEKVSRRLEKRQLAGKTVSLKLRYDDFTTFTRQASFRDAIWDSKSIVSVAVHLLDAHWTERRKVRLIGVGLSSLEDSQSNPQLRLFDQ